MFVQIIQGMVSDKDEMRAAVDRWVDEVSPGAIGWLGSTGGVTDAGQLIAVVRFESEDAAGRNSDRPEQDAWWTQMSKLFTTEPTFTDTDVLTTRGYSVMEARGDDLLARALAVQPDIIMLNSVSSARSDAVQMLRFEKGMENVLFLVYQ